MPRRLEIEVGGDSRDFTENMRRAAGAVEGLGASATDSGKSVRVLGRDSEQAGRQARSASGGFGALRTGISALATGAATGTVARVVAETTALGASLQKTSSITGTIVEDLQSLGSSAAAAGPLVDGLGNAFEETGDEAREASEGFGALRTGIVALASGAAVGAIASIVAAATALGTSLQKTSSITGTSVEDLQRLRHAFSLFGADVEEADQILVDLNQALSEAARGEAAQVEAFRGLRVAVRDGSGELRSAVDILEELSGVVDESNVRELQADLGILFGEDGFKQAAPILLQTSDAFRTTLSDFDALVTTENTSKLARLNVGFTDLGQTVSALFANAVARVSEDVQEIVGLVTTALSALDRAAQRRSVFAAVGAGEGVGLDARSAQSLLSELDLQVFEVQERISAAVSRGVPRGIAEFFFIPDGAQAELTENVRQSLLGVLHDAGEEAAPSLAEGITAGLARPGAIGISALDLVQPDFAEGIDNSGFERLAQVYADVSQAVRDVGDAHLYALPLLTELSEEARLRAAAIGDAYRLMGASVSNAFDQIVEGGREANEVLRELLANLVRAIASGLLAAAGSGSGNPFLQGFLGGFQTGGVIPGPGFALVGERGAELIQTRGGERVFNARDTQRMLGGGGLTINVEAGVNEAAVRRVIQEEAAYIQADVLSSVQRRGAMRNAIRSAAR